MNKDELQKKICEQLCTDIHLEERPDGKLMVSNPFSYPDGDHYSLYFEELGDENIRISDEANTMMKLSYDTPDIEKYFKDKKGELLEQILRENNVKQDDGNFYVVTSKNKISESIFHLGQAINQIYDLSYLNRDRHTKTFYKEMEELLRKIVSEHTMVELEKDYAVPGLANVENYPVDYSLKKDGQDRLFLFGIPNADKARLVTITLRHLQYHHVTKPALLVFENQEQLPSKDMSRLMDANIGGSQVSSIDSAKSIEQNIERYALAH